MFFFSKLFCFFFKNNTLIKTTMTHPAANNAQFQLSRDMNVSVASAASSSPTITARACESCVAAIVVDVVDDVAVVVVVVGVSHMSKQPDAFTRIIVFFSAKTTTAKIQIFFKKI